MPVPKIRDRGLRSVAVHVSFLAVFQPFCIPKAVSVMPYESSRSMQMSKY